MDRYAELRRQVEQMEAELPEMERWRDEADTAGEFAERAALVREQVDGIHKSRKALDYSAKVRNRLALLQEHQPHSGATMGEVFEKRGGRWVPKTGRNE